MLGDKRGSAPTLAMFAIFAIFTKFALIPLERSDSLPPQRSAPLSRFPRDRGLLVETSYQPR